MTTSGARYCCTDAGHAAYATYAASAHPMLETATLAVASAPNSALVGEKWSYPNGFQYRSPARPPVRLHARYAGQPTRSAPTK